MTRDTVPETCHPYGVRNEGGAASHVLQTCRSYGAKRLSICHVSKCFRSTDYFKPREFCFFAYKTRETCETREKKEKKK